MNTPSVRIAPVISAGADSVKSILFALGANFLIALAQTGGAIFTGSSSMLAEPHRRAHAVQHGRPVLDLRGLAQAGGDRAGAERLGGDRHPRVRFAAESVSLWGCLREVNKDRGRQGLWRWFRSSRQSELLVVFAEDIAALGGLTMALVFIAISMATGNPAWDAAGSIAIGVLLVLVAVLVGVEVKELLLGQSVEGRVLERMRAHLAAHDEVETVYNMLTQQLGPAVMVAVKAKMRPAASAQALVESINRVEQGFRAAFPQVQWLFFEPDVAD